MIRAVRSDVTTVGAGRGERVEGRGGGGGGGGGGRGGRGGTCGALADASLQYAQAEAKAIQGGRVLARQRFRWQIDRSARANRMLRSGSSGAQQLGSPQIAELTAGGGGQNLAQRPRTD